MKVYLIRHGKTEANEHHLYCGSTDLGLSEAGRQELLQRRYDVKPARFYSSGMRRADETLQLLFGPVPFIREPRFREVDFGIFEMYSYQQLKEDPSYQQWLEGDNERNVPPGGESGLQMKQRVLEAFAQLPEESLVVTHGGVIAAIMASLFPQEEKSRYAWQPPNGGGYLVWDGGYRTL